jgi:MSHA pilin protein MshD
MTHRPRRSGDISTRRPGLTLTESVIACVIVATMIVSALGAVGGAARARVLQKDQLRGVTLARQLLAEITQSAYRDTGANPTFGPEAGETRATFNDVDDYNGLIESPPTDRNASPLSGYTGWTRSTKVEYVDPTLLTVVVGSDTGLKRIIVTASSPTGRVTTLCAFRAATGAFEKNVASQTTYVGWTGVTLQVGSDSSTRVQSGAVPLNQLP